MIVRFMYIFVSLWLLVGLKLSTGWFIHRRMFASVASKKCKSTLASAPVEDVMFEEHMETMAKTALRQVSLVFDCDRIDPDEISEVLLELGVLSVSVEMVGEKANALNEEKNWLDLIKTRYWSTAMLRANVPSSFDAEGLSKTIRSIYWEQPLDIRLDAIEDKDWVMHVQQLWKPQVIGDLTIRFPWHEPAEITTMHSLVLEGGAAFGTGDHPTTRLCCRWLQSAVKASDNSTLLDYGCGSAILGLVALKYGASHVTGTDIDKDALSSAKRNSERNDLHMDLYAVGEEAGHDRNEECESIFLNTWRGSTEDFPSTAAINDTQFDLVVANILAPILINLAPILSKHVKSSGKLALSGIMAKQAESVLKVYQAYFSNVQVHETEGDWVLITAYNKM